MGANVDGVAEGVPTGPILRDGSIETIGVGEATEAKRFGVPTTLTTRRAVASSMSATANPKVTPRRRWGVTRV